MDTSLLFCAVILLVILAAVGYRFWPRKPTFEELRASTAYGRPTGSKQFDVEPRRNAMLAAIRNTWEVSIVYWDKEGQRTERRILPFWDNGRFVKAHCRLRNDERKFVYAGIESIEVHARRSDACDRYRVRS